MSEQNIKEQLKAADEKQSKSRKADQKAEKKSVKTWIVVLLLCGFGGGILGAFTDQILALFDWENFGEDFIRYGRKGAPLVMLAGNIILFAVAMCQYAKCRAMTFGLDEDSEDYDDLFDEIELKLSNPLLVSNIGMIFNFVMFGVVTYIEQDYVDLFGKDVLANNLLLANCGMMLLSLAWVTAIQYAVIGLEKKLNPEKKGSIFDVNFAKQWLDSSDEAQQIMTYKAAYKAYQVTVYTCIGLWLICLLGMMAFHTSVMPVICIGIIWLVAVVVYHSEAVRLERGSKGK